MISFGIGEEMKASAMELKSAENCLRDFSLIFDTDNVLTLDQFID